MHTFSRKRTRFSPNFLLIMAHIIFPRFPPHFLPPPHTHTHTHIPETGKRRNGWSSWGLKNDRFSGGLGRRGWHSKSINLCFFFPGAAGTRNLWHQVRVIRQHESLFSFISYLHFSGGGASPACWQHCFPKDARQMSKRRLSFTVV